MNMPETSDGTIGAGYPRWMVWALFGAGALAVLTAGVLLNLGWMVEGPDGLRTAALLVGLCCLGLGGAAIAVPYVSAFGWRARRTD